MYILQGQEYSLSGFALTWSDGFGPRWVPRLESGTVTSGRILRLGDRHTDPLFHSDDSQQKAFLPQSLIPRFLCPSRALASLWG